MKRDETSEFNEYIHNARNPLNSISLHAELGKMLLEENASTEQVMDVFSSIMRQCASCEKVLTELREKFSD